MKRIMAICLALVLLACAIPMPQADAATKNMTATVKGGWLRLREEPNTSAKTIASYYTGTKVTILGTSGNWYYVKVGSKQGYMMGSYLNFNADTGATNAPSGNLNITAWITSANGLPVRLRSGPSTGYGVLSSYAVGTQVTILAKGSYWFQISVNGKIGYMMSQYLTTSKPGTSGGTTSAPSSGSIAYVYAANGGNVNLRAGAGTNYGVLGSYSVGTQVTVLSSGKTWSYIRVGTRTGYMMTKFLTATAPSNPTAPPASSGSYIAYVTSTNGYGVRMRTGAGTSYRVLATLPVGTQVTVLQHNAKWDYIRYGTTDGYMQNSFLTTIQPDDPAAPPTGGYYATVYTAANNSPVRMRKGAGTNYDVIVSVPQGTRVTVLSESGDWCYISYNGITGYMMKSFLVKDTTSYQFTKVALNNYSPKPGDTLSVTVEPANATYTYAWVDAFNNVLSTAATYTVKTEDVGKMIAVRVTGTGSYQGSDALSAYAIVASPESAKTALTGVTISGVVKCGETLTANILPAGATANVTWYSGSGAVLGTGATLKLTAANWNSTVYCEAVGTGDYTGTAKSEITASVATNTDLMGK